MDPRKASLNIPSATISDSESYRRRGASILIERNFERDRTGLVNTRSLAETPEETASEGERKERGGDDRGLEDGGRWRIQGVEGSRIVRVVIGRDSRLKQ